MCCSRVRAALGWSNERLGDGRSMSLQRYNGGLRGMRGEVLEGGIRVPTVVRWPAGLASASPDAPARGETPVTVDAMIHFCDWLPTPTAAAGVTARPPNALDGINVLPVLQGTSSSVIEKRFWQYNRYDPVPNCNAAVRDGPWKLVWPAIQAAMSRLPVDEVWRRGMVGTAFRDARGYVRHSPGYSPGTPELYCIDEDPGEKQDLSARFQIGCVRCSRTWNAGLRRSMPNVASLPDAWRGVR